MVVLAINELIDYFKNVNLSINGITNRAVVTHRGSKYLRMYAYTGGYTAIFILENNREISSLKHRL